MKLVKEYTIRLVFAAGILFGVQVPNFIDQYTQRISAHHLEATENFSGFQAIADKFHGGSVEALIEGHEGSNDPVFRSEAKPIKEIYSRIQAFSSELNALDTDLFNKIIHVAFKSDSAVFKEAISEYSATVPLSTDAIICGLGLGLGSALVFDIFFSILSTVFGMWLNNKRVIADAR
jgi:hypothetical protein